MEARLLKLAEPPRQVSPAEAQLWLDGLHQPRERSQVFLEHALPEALLDVVRPAALRLPCVA